MSLKKIVNLPVVVPEGEYCATNNHKVHCSHFDSRGDSAMCTLHVGRPILEGNLTSLRGGDWLKPEECFYLKEEENDSCQKD